MLALAAGADLLCIGADVDAALVEEVAAEIVAAVGDGRLRAGAGSRRRPAAYRRAGRLDRGARAARPRRDAELGYAAARRAVRVEGSLAGLGDAAGGRSCESGVIDRRGPGAVGARART